MSKLTSVAPVFAVADVEATIRWYESELGFTSYPSPPQITLCLCQCLSRPG